MHRKSLRVIIIAATCVAIPSLILLLHLTTSPRFVSLSPDSGVFAYAGKLVTEGKLPYRDFFDHKPPLIYYLEALAISISGPNPWSIWWLDVIYLAVTGIVFFLVLSKVTHVITGSLTSGIFILTLMTPQFFTGGNYTETYGLLPQVLIIGAAYGYLRNRKSLWVFLIGIITALASLFKQTNIALGVGSAFVVLYLDFLSRQARLGVKHALIFISGFLLPWGITAALWAGLGAFPQFWDAVVMYNLFYVQNGISAKGFYETYQIILGSVPLLPLMVIAFAGFCVFVLVNKAWLFHRIQSEAVIRSEENDPSVSEKLFLAVFAAIPFEILFISLSGRNYGHYFITLFPSVVFACGYAINKLINETPVKNLSQAASMGFTGLLLVIWFVPTFSSVHPQRQHLYSLRMLGDTSLVQDDLLSYINEHTKPNDPVLFWQVRTGVNFVTGRPAPSRYIYPLPLFVRTEGSPSRFEQFMQDIKAHQPALIILLVNDQTVPAFDLPDDKLCPNCIPEAMEGMKELKAFVLSNYQVADKFDEYKVYEKVK
jgi:hypothetical protein